MQAGIQLNDRCNLRQAYLRICFQRVFVGVEQQVVQVYDQASRRLRRLQHSVQLGAQLLAKGLFALFAGLRTLVGCIFSSFSSCLCGLGLLTRFVRLRLGCSRCSIPGLRLLCFLLRLAACAADSAACACAGSSQLLCRRSSACLRNVVMRASSKFCVAPRA